MRTCRLCQWVVTLDDVAVLLRGDSRICLRCFLRETGDTRTMTEDFQREIDEALQSVVGGRWSVIGDR